MEYLRSSFRESPPPKSKIGVGIEGHYRQVMMTLTMNLDSVIKRYIAATEFPSDFSEWFRALLACFRWFLRTAEGIPALTATGT